jgi:hypothetical protein
MPGWLQPIIDWLVPFVGGGLVAGVGIMLRYGRALVKGMQAMMRGELHRIHRETVRRGLPVDLDVAEEADDVYDAYHSLGGNGVGTQLHDEIIAAAAAGGIKEDR